jgi:hypothetical protein
MLRFPLLSSGPYPHLARAALGLLVGRIDLLVGRVCSDSGGGGGGVMLARKKNSSWRVSPVRRSASARRQIWMLSLTAFCCVHIQIYPTTSKTHRQRAGTMDGYSFHSVNFKHTHRVFGMLVIFDAVYFRVKVQIEDANLFKQASNVMTKGNKSRGTDPWQPGEALDRLQQTRSAL